MQTEEIDLAFEEMVEDDAGWLVWDKDSETDGINGTW